MMQSFNPERESLAVSRIQQGLGGTNQGRQKAVSVAKRLSSLALISGKNVQFEPGEEIDVDDFNLQTEHFRRARKIAEVLEEEFRVDVGHYKFTQIATTAAQLQSYVSIVIAGNNLLVASEELVDEYEETNSLEEVSDGTYDDFYRSSSIFILECMLFVTPINYRVAWRGTRYVNNRYLYHLRDYSTSIYRLILSEIHFIIRDVVPTVIRSSIDELSSYLVWTTKSSIEILYQYGSIDLGDAQAVRDVLTEFIDFAQDTYDVGRSTIEELDISSLISTIISELSDLVDVPFSEIESEVDLDT